MQFRSHMGLNDFMSIHVTPIVKATHILGIMAAFGITAAGAQTCRETVRDPAGRVVKQIERRQLPGGATQTVERDSAGRILGTSSSTTSGGSVHTQYRDASGRTTGSATTSASSSGSSHTTYRDASGRSAGSATTSASGTAYRDASGRSMGRLATHGSGSTRYDASGRTVASSNASGACRNPAKVPAPVPLKKP
jgi:hypothetical protein